MAADWFVVREAENNGLLADMTSGTERRNRTDQNSKLSSYFKSKMPNYTGLFDEYKGEDILCNINEYVNEKGIDKFKYEISFPFSDGTDIYLIPISDNIQLKLEVADEYYGGGSYSKYVSAEYFVINENSNESDVDKLISFLHDCKMV